MTPIQQKWITKLLGLNYEIQYRKGTENRAADALSRVRNDGGNCLAITTMSPAWVQDAITSYIGDDYCTKLLAELAVNQLSHPNYTLDSGLLRYKGRVVIGSNTALKSQILATMHSSPYGGHSGVTGTYMRLKVVFYWPKMKEDIIGLIKGCDICRKNKPESGPTSGLLQPLPIPDQAWTHINMDFVEDLPKSWGKDVILVVVDRFTKYGHFLALCHTLSQPKE